MKLELLHEFIVLAKHRNFTNAAKELYLSQPSLSMHMSTLENELGVKLIERSNNSFNLTTEGTIFLSYAQKIRATYLEAKAACSEVAQKHPLLKISSLSSDTAYYRTLIALEGHPFTFVDLGFETSFLKLLKRGVVDCGVCYHYPSYFQIANDERFEGIEFVPIGTTRLAICMMSTHRLASKARLTRADLQGETAVIFSGNHFDDWQHVVQCILGNEVSLAFHLIPVESLDNLAFMDLRDMLYFCGHESINTHFSRRDDIVIFDTVDGKELLCSDAFAYRAHDETAAELARTLQAKLEL